MHDKDIIKILQHARGETDAPLHREALRRAILSKKRGSFAPLQDFITQISMHKYYLSVGTVAAVAAIAAVVALSPISPSTVSAQEQVQRAFARATALTPEMRAEIEEKMKADMLKTLEEAKAAPDLKIMTKEEYEKDAQFTISRGPMGTQGITEARAIHLAHLDAAKKVGVGEGTITFSHSAGTHIEGHEAGESVMFAAKEMVPADLKGSSEVSKVVVGHNVMMGGVHEFSEPVKYLSYTDPEGRKTVLGLDQNDTPVFKFTTLNASDIKRFEFGAAGAPAAASVKIEMQKAE
jgi:hypothetical protein